MAEAVEQHAAGATALYDITIKDEQSGKLVAKNQALVYRKKEWFVPEEGITDVCCCHSAPSGYK